MDRKVLSDIDQYVLILVIQFVERVLQFSCAVEMQKLNYNIEIKFSVFKL